MPLPAVHVEGHYASHTTRDTPERAHEGKRGQKGRGRDREKEKERRERERKRETESDCTMRLATTVATSVQQPYHILGAKTHAKKTWLKPQ